ncbi:MAG: T9SS type A sorting domain-containing protein [Bacteroidota bacterium]
MKRILFCLTLCSILLNAKILKVPAEYPGIQSAIYASVNGDSVVVSPGTYFENINYHGKNIVVTSRFYETHDIAFIYSTVINGSKPASQDSASVVRFISHEDSTAVIQGFTLTGGKGTAWPDEHSAGTFIEGGGIMAALASPRIQFNLIINNEAVGARNGITSAGGGGIRVGDGNPTIVNNVIIFNRGKYGAGVVANYSGLILRNNIIAGNSGGADFGGGGVWLNGSAAKPKYLENNTIVGNRSLLDGGGILFYDGTAASVLRNNIVWGNSAVTFPQISFNGAAMNGGYNSVQGTVLNGTNLTTAPSFRDSMLYLSAASLLIDAGDTSSFYNDKNTGGAAFFPSLGTKRNDIGAYGGPSATLLPMVAMPHAILSLNQISYGKIRPDSMVNASVLLYNGGSIPLRIDSIRFAFNAQKNLSVSRSAPFSISSISVDSVIVQWHPKLPQVLNDTVLIYLNDSGIVLPLQIVLSGKAFAIEKALAGVMYSGSGSSDSAKLYSIDTAKSLSSFLGKTGFSQIVSMRVDPKSQELIALVNQTAPQLLRLSSTNAESFLLPSLTLSNPKGMVFRPDGSLLIGTFSGTFYSVNMTTGAAVAVGSNGLRVAGLAYNPVNGTLWMSVRPTSSGKDNIYKLNPSTLAATLVGATGFGVSVKDITFDAQGRLFGVMDTVGSQSYLIRIDTLNGKGTLIGGLTVKGIETIDLQSYFVTAVVNSVNTLPMEYSLSQNYPNPFNPNTTINYSIGEHRPGVQNREGVDVSLKIYDMMGKEISTLVNAKQTPGSYSVHLNASALSSGIYFYRLRSGPFVSVKKMSFIK